MVEGDRAFSGAIPGLYDRHLGPWLFEPYAADLAARVAPLGANDVLETAAGTGILTRALRAALPRATAIVATDLNQPMLDHAASSIPGPAITWRQADATALPFADESFDVVVCQFGFMFFPDKVAASREARRVLRVGGVFLFNVWDSIETNPGSLVVCEALAELFPASPPMFLKRTPHGWHDPDRIIEPLKAAGFDRIEHAVVRLVGQAASHRDPALGFCLGSPLRGELEAAHPGRLEEAVEHAAAALAARFGSGPITTEMSAVVFAAVRDRA